MLIIYTLCWRGRLTNAWFDKSNHGRLHCNLSDIDNNLIKQCPPQEFSRSSRSVEMHLKFWKASEFRTWLLYYFLPILKLFTSTLLVSLRLAGCAIHILLRDYIEAAENMLNVLLPELYGETSCTSNAHLLLHLTKYVRLRGPLWTHSAFGFENKNCQFKHLYLTLYIKYVQHKCRLLFATSVSSAGST